MVLISLRKALKRCIFHTIIGLSAVTTLLFSTHVAAIATLTAVTVVFSIFELVRLKSSIVNKWFIRWFGFLLRDEEKHRISAASYSLTGFLVTAIAFNRDIAVMAVIFVALGDPIATIIGMWKGHARLWGRSMEGDAACLLACLVAGYFAVSVLGIQTYPVVITGAIFATIFQALPLIINDNLTIPVGSALAMFTVSVII